MYLLQTLAPTPRQVEAAVNVPDVDVVPLTYRDSPLMIDGNGLVQPRAAIVVASQVSGEVTHVHPQLRSGGYFRDGDLLIELDPRPFEAALEEAIATRDAVQANLSFLERQSERQRRLQADGLVGEELLDDVVSRRNQAAAELRRQDAVIVRRRLDLEYSRITAPFDGFVFSENVDVGDIVSPGSELARFHASDNFEVVVSLNVRDAGFIPKLWSTGSTEQRAAWVETQYGDHRYRWPAVVDRVEASVDSVSRTIDVVVTVSDPGQPGTRVGAARSGLSIEPPPLLVGMYAMVSIEGMALPEHFILPVSAVTDSSIRIVDEENRLRIADVEVIRQEGNEFVLQAPSLAPGTPIIVSTLAISSDGMLVNVADKAEPPRP